MIHKNQLSKIKHMVIASMLIAMTSNIRAQEWKPLSSDGGSDASGTGPDGTKLEYYYDETSDELSFRISTTGISAAQAADIGVNIMINVPKAGATFKFWGNVNKAAYHRLVTAWVKGSPPSNYTGTIGIANAAGVNTTSWTNLHRNNLDIQVSPAEGTIVVSMAREDLITDAMFMASGTKQFAVAAATGTSSRWGDDIYKAGDKLSLDLLPVGTIDLSALQNDLSIFPNPISGSELHVAGLTAKGSFEIYSTSGAMMSQGRVSAGRQVISTGSLEPGLYVLRLYDDSGVPVLSKKLIKQ